MSAANHIIHVTPKCAARRRIAGMGTSPAVLTNAVWSLAHQKKPVVPDGVVAPTTKVLIR